MAILYLVRHGHIERNGRFIGRTDVSLSSLGHDQALRLGRLLSHVSFDKCFSSPLVRSLETARHILAENSPLNQPMQEANDAKQRVKDEQKAKWIEATEGMTSYKPCDTANYTPRGKARDATSAKASSISGSMAGGTARAKEAITNNEPMVANSHKIAILPELMEISLGMWEGQTKAEVMAKYPFVWKERGANPTTVAPPQGENYAMLYERMAPVFETLSSFRNEENVLVVAHRSVGQVLMGHFAHFPFEVWPHLDMPYGSVTLCPLCQ